MTREQLEEELAKTVNSDDFEKAVEIRALIKKLDNSQEGDNENNE
jgi:protein-arginine kinase activator protein McsA